MGETGQFEDTRGSAPEAEEERAGLATHLIVWDDVCKLKAHVADVLQHGVPLLAPAHQDGIGIHLHHHADTDESKRRFWSEGSCQVPLQA